MEEEEDSGISNMVVAFGETSSNALLWTLGRDQNLARILQELEQVLEQKFGLFSCVRRSARLSRFTLDEDVVLLNLEHRSDRIRLRRKADVGFWSANRYCANAVLEIISDCAHPIFKSRKVNEVTMRAACMYIFYWKDERRKAYQSGDDTTPPPPKTTVSPQKKRKLAPGRLLQTPDFVEISAEDFARSKEEDTIIVGMPTSTAEPTDSVHTPAATGIASPPPTPRIMQSNYAGSASIRRNDRILAYPNSILFQTRQTISDFERERPSHAKVETAKLKLLQKQMQLKGVEKEIRKKETELQALGDKLEGLKEEIGDREKTLESVQKEGGGFKGKSKKVKDEGELLGELLGDYGGEDSETEDEAEWMEI